MRKKRQGSRYSELQPGSSSLRRPSKTLETPQPLLARRTEGMLGGALGRIFALSESYPDLKANQNGQFTGRIKQYGKQGGFLSSGFQRLGHGHNTYKQTFPPVIFAGMFGHGQDGTLLEFESEKIKEAPKVQF